ncbi:MAG: hypothetical protein GYA60_01810 [Candidatus Methanofastidiosa archaeon]|nr:hypothetical protein [Candidatus Methanofastidiosa archaeon]
MELLEKICSFIEDYGWKYNKINEETILCKFLGEKADTEFALFIQVNEYWVDFIITPYFLPTQRDIENILLKRISKINQQAKFIRFALGDNDEVTINANIPVQFLERDFLNMTLDLISYYADELYLEFFEIWSKNN